MTSIENRVHDDEDDLRSDSTIRIEFNESVLQKRATTYDSNRNASFSSFQRCHSRKRSTSEENCRETNEQENASKKQRNHMNHTDGFDHNHKQRPIFSTEFTDLPYNQQKNNDFMSETHFQWFQEFMKQSLNTIRETIVQVCTNALSTQSMMPSNINHTVQDINRNNHLIGRSHSDNSCVSYKSQHCLQSCELKNRPSIQEKRRLSLIRQQCNGDDDDDDEKNDYADKRSKVHNRARTSPYPTCKSVYRTLVNDIQVPWSYEWPQYKPTIFTAEEIFINPGADPDLLKSSSSSEISLHFNAIDGAVDRRSVFHNYHVRDIDGLPLNPIGRTGLQGRGSLLRWGPNIYHYVMICRWKRNMNGNIHLHPSNGKRILEILLELQTNGQELYSFILTGGLHMLGSQFPPQLQDRLRRFIHHTDSIMNRRKRTSSSQDSLNRLFEQTPTSWKGAYFDDARNTDNAWIELSIEYFLDSDHQLTMCIPNLSRDQLRSIEQPRFIWKEITNGIHIGPRTHYRLIKGLAHKLDAHF